LAHHVIPAQDNSAAFADAYVESMNGMVLAASIDGVILALPFIL
jgi:hypothetical protein